MREPFRRIDRWLLLRHPRIWSTRIHVALLVVLPLYGLLAIIGLVIRVILTPSTTQLVNGEASRPSSLSPRAIATASDQFQDSLLLSIAQSSVSSTIATTTGLIFVAATLAGLLLALIWLRQINQHSIERIVGVHKPGHGWLECACYILGAGLFASFGLWVYLWMSPSTTQIAAWREIDSASRREIAALAQARGYVTAPSFDAADGTINFWDVARHLVDSPDWQPFTDLKLVRPTDIDFDSKVAPAAGYRLQYQNTPLAEPAASYLNTLAASAYADVFLSPTSSARMLAINGFAGGFLPWILGLLGYALFAGKKTKMRYAVSVIALMVFVVPIIVVIVTQIALQIYLVLSGSSYSDQAHMLTLAITGVYAALFALVLALSLIGRYASTSSRRHVLATIAVPVGIGFGIFITMAIADDLLSRDAWPSQPQDSAQYQAYLAVWSVVIRCLPFVWLPIVPLLDTAFRRWQATPKA